MFSVANQYDLYDLCVCVRHSRVWLFATPWTVALKAPLSMELSRQEYWSGFSFPSAGTVPDPGVEPGSPALQADSLNDNKQKYHNK